MSEPVKPGANDAAEYVLGLLGTEDSEAFAQRLKSDEALRAQVEYWEGMLADLPAGEAESPPSGTFEKILDRIEGEGADLPGTLTKRAGKANWFEISPGIKGRLLHVDRAQNRQHLLIRMAPGASYRPHAHDADEQTLVIEGDLSFGDLDLKAGDFHVATPSSLHPPGRTVNGCLVHVIMSLDQR
jgi:anti-sigma factor ChrR (cupin superfamily)